MYLTGTSTMNLSNQKITEYTNLSIFVNTESIIKTGLNVYALCSVYDNPDKKNFLSSIPVYTSITSTDLTDEQIINIILTFIKTNIFKNLDYVND